MISFERQAVEQVYPIRHRAQESSNFDPFFRVWVRGKRAGAFGEEQVRMMNILAPHVTRAVQVHRRLGSLTVEKEWALGALGHLRMGVILTDDLDGGADENVKF